MIAMMLEEFLESLGHQVRGIAATVGEAEQKVRDGGFDLAILDCHLGDGDIWPVARMLDDAAIPFILSSGGMAGDIPAPFTGRPMLAKPYTIGTISDLLAKG